MSLDLEYADQCLMAMYDDEGLINAHPNLVSIVELHNCLQHAVEELSEHRRLSQGRRWSPLRFFSRRSARMRDRLMREQIVSAAMLWHAERPDRVDVERGAMVFVGDAERLRRFQALRDACEAYLVFRHKRVRVKPGQCVTVSNGSASPSLRRQDGRPINRSERTNTNGIEKENH